MKKRHVAFSIHSVVSAAPILIAIVPCAVSACGTTSNSTPIDASTLLVDGSIDSSKSDDGGIADGQTPSDGGDGGIVPADADTYMQGVYTCCDENIGLACCTVDAGLLGYDVTDAGIIAHGGRPNGGTEANCFRYGGTPGRCMNEGETFFRKDICTLCCDGLQALPTLCPNGPCIDGGGIGLPGERVCTHCGDGLCGVGEGPGNCPKDCK